MALPTADEDWEGETMGIKGGDGGQDQRGNPETQKGPGQGPGAGGEEIDISKLDRKAIDALVEQTEQARFEQAEEKIRQAIEEDAHPDRRQEQDVDVPFGLRSYVCTHSGTHRIGRKSHRRSGQSDFH